MRGAVTAQRPSEAALADAPPCSLGTRTPLSREQMLAAPVRWPRPSALASPLQRSAPKLAGALQSLGIATVGELIEHLPRELRASRSIQMLKVGEQATIAVQVSSIKRRTLRRRGGRSLTLVEAQVRDHSGSISATFFNQPWLVDRYGEGTKLLLHGALRPRRGFAVSHHALAPESEPVAGEGQDTVAHYPVTEGVSSTQMLTLVQRHRAAIEEIPEPLPGRLRAAQGLPDRAAALSAMHFPSDAQQQEAGRRRLAFEELLLSQIALRRRRALHSGAKSPPLSGPRDLTQRWLTESLPFAPTADQETAMRQIDEDLARAQPMQRLLMGEVGSGKTVVALYAMLRAVEHGMQAALMAPTETLAEQHFATLQALAPEGLIGSALLTGSTPAARRRDALGKLASGQLQLLVGTHALIESDVQFARLAVVVVDEQHRFGVAQRTALGARDPAPHVLHMTATPIPRTLWLAQYGDLDATRLTQLPAGRKPIATHVASSSAERERAYERIREELRAGRQAFVVCALVSESEQLDARAATAEYERLSSGELSGFRLGLLHGQMRPQQKQATMAAFAGGETDVLIATTVIEVGIDVPNATVMLIEDADRYGISQLHQLRGRVGRGGHASLCLLFGTKTSRRLQALARHDDGFALAEIDLHLRGAGDLEDAGQGVRQSGQREGRIARLPQDTPLLEAAHAWAGRLLDADPDLDAPEHALLRHALRAIPA
ncbi:MAG TPA: ATP-dependent DNA helicase RecG [Solirubrobacteraceae bacterium]|nr:ATP-dependent DNA helicase RecG [Solirubrobacteraceae bacterium]